MVEGRNYLVVHADDIEKAARDSWMQKVVDSFGAGVLAVVESDLAARALSD